MVHHPTNSPNTLCDRLNLLDVHWGMEFVELQVARIDDADAIGNTEPEFPI